MLPKIPGQLLGDPGTPLNNSQSRALLDQLYRLADRPPVQTSGKRVFKDISETEDATQWCGVAQRAACRFETSYNFSATATQLVTFSRG